MVVEKRSGGAGATRRGDIATAAVTGEKKARPREARPGPWFDREGVASITS